MPNVMVVDDSPSIRELVSDVLESMGHQVFRAEDGVRALEIAESTPMDLVVTDVNMPRLGGVGLVKALRRQPRYAKTPILVLTTETSLKKAVMAAGATGVGYKPFQAARFREVVTRLLG